MSQIEKQKQSALKIVRTLQEKGHIAFFAGGCVRDQLLGRTPKDYDVATDAFPEEVETIFPKTLPLGKAFGVIAVIDNKEVIEVATFREEIGTLNGRHPETIMFSAAEEDALRRDFTINGIFYDPIADKLYDYVHGQQDLKRKIITAIGNPAERFEEDHLRMLRAVRFAYTLDFQLDPATADAIRTMAPLVKKISIERIETEFSRTLTESDRPGDALRTLLQLNLLEQIIPELLPLVGQKQPPQFHPEGDVFEHTVLMLNIMGQQKETLLQNPKYTPRELAYAALLHDVGKPPTAKMGTDQQGNPRIRFDGHDKTSAKMAEEILTRLKLPTREKKNIIHAIHGHMRFLNVKQMRKATLRKFIGSNTYELEMALHKLDCLGSHELMDHYTFVRDFQEKMRHEPILPEPWIRGTDLIKLGIPPGKQIGTLLKQAYDAQIENQFPNRDALLHWIKQIKDQ